MLLPAALAVLTAKLEGALSAGDSTIAADEAEANS
jgi:hypothetical protein